MRILWLKTELLHPVDKGGKIRTYQMLKELKRQQHHVTYLTLDDGEAEINARELAESEYCDEAVVIPHRTSAKFSAKFYRELAANLVSKQPYFMLKYASKIMRDEIRKRAASADFDVLVCDFLMPGINVPANIKCPTVLFQHNVEAQIWRRHYEVQSHPLKKLYLREQWRKTRAIEAAECQRFDCVIAVSSEDARMMEREYSLAHVADVPTGVDVDFFRSASHAQPLAGRANNLVFTGSMDWLPNEDAIKFFVAEILPRVRAEVPDVTLTVVGRNPFSGLVEMSKQDKSIIVTGRVEDVRPFMDAAAAYIVPLRIGGGTRLKIYEALAMNLPMVSTTVGAEGLPLSDERELCIADTPEDFARSVVRLLKDRNYARELGERAARRVREEFGWRQVAEKFALLCEETIKAKRAASLNSFGDARHITTQDASRRKDATV